MCTWVVPTHPRASHNLQLSTCLHAVFFASNLTLTHLTHLSVAITTTAGKEGQTLFVFSLFFTASSNGCDNQQCQLPARRALLGPPLVNCPSKSSSIWLGSWVGLAWAPCLCTQGAECTSHSQPARRCELTVPPGGHRRSPCAGYANASEGSLHSRHAVVSPLLCCRLCVLLCCSSYLTAGLPQPVLCATLWGRSYAYCLWRARADRKIDKVSVVSFPK